MYEVIIEFLCIRRPAISLARVNSYARAYSRCGKFVALVRMRCGVAYTNRLYTVRDVPHDI